MNKVLAIIGALLIVAAAGLGYFVDFPGDTIVELAIAAFGIVALVINAVKKAKEAGKFSWPTVVCIILALVGGGLCCIGGLDQSIFKVIVGGVLALMAVIFGILYPKRE